MNGERALRVLEALIQGRLDGVTGTELDELVDAELAVVADPQALLRADENRVLTGKFGAKSIDDLRRALTTIEDRLRSDFHRMMSFASTLRSEEQDRVLLRRALGVLAQPAEWKKVQDALTAKDRAATNAPFVSPAGDPRRFAVSAIGLRAAGALRVRLPRFATAPLEAFLVRFRKTDTAMAAFAQQHANYLRDLAGVMRNRSGVAIGLAKSGLKPEVALARYGSAVKSGSGMWLSVEAPHMAVAMVRKAGEQGDLGQAVRRHDAAYQALVAVGYPATPVVRGAAKALMDAADVKTAAERLKQIDIAIPGRAPHDQYRMRSLARVFGVAATPQDIARRCQNAAKALADDPGNSDRVLTARTAALVAGAADDTELAAHCERYRAIARELVERRAFPGLPQIPASAVDLVRVPGTPAEVVELVRQLVAHLPARESVEQWGVGEDWEPAVAFARRFAF